MNNSTYDKDALLEELNNEKAVLMVPVMILLALFMVTGLIGNATVCFYYGVKTKRTTSSIFIVVLALFDITVCSVVIPIEFVDLRYFYDFENGTACKFMRFVNHIAAIGSALTLLVIAIDRYRRICRPFKRQLNLRDAKVASAVATGFALLLAWPACVFYDAVEVNVKNDFGIEITGTDCTTTKEKSYRLTLWIFNGVHFLIFIASVITLVVVYSKVGRVVYVHSKNKKITVVSSIKFSSDSDQVATDSCELSDDKVSHNGTQQSATAVAKKVSSKRETFQISEGSSNPDNKTGKSLDLKTIKYTMIMLVVTIVYIVSFLPYLCIVIWRIVLGKYEADVLSDGALLAVNIGIRSYMLNSVMNPIIYGFFNSKFRRFFCSLVCPCCARVSRKVSISSSET